MIRSSATYSEILPLRGIKSKQFLVIAVSIAQDLGWNIDRVSNAGLTAFADSEASKTNVKITIRIENYSAEILTEAVAKENQDPLKMEKAISDFTSALYQPTHVYSAQELDEGYESLKPYFSADDESLPNRSSALKEARTELLSVFQRRDHYFVTPVLMMINIIIFFALLFVAKSLHFDGQFMLRWGANARLATLNGEPWRLLTSCFLHWDFVHLFMNMMALYFIGSFLEQYIGKITFIVVYLIMGIVASVTSLYWHEHGVAAGASGAIFGLYGIFVAFLTTNLITQGERVHLVPGAVIFLAYSLIADTKGNVDNAAHIGGLISGVFIGYCLYPILRNNRRKVRI